MSEPDWRRFLEGYATWRDPSAATVHAPFWRIAAVLKSLDLRVSRYPTRTAMPIGRLRRLLAQLDEASGTAALARPTQRLEHVEQGACAQDSDRDPVDERSRERLDREHR